MTKLEEKVKIAIETNNFTTTKRKQSFYKAIAKHFKEITGWFEGCTVHHIDENTCNNHPSNLKCMTKSDHTRLHSLGNQHNKGRKHQIDTETRIKISNTLKGHEISEETRKKISNTLKGHETSEETRLKLSKASKGRKLSDEAKKKIGLASKGRNIGKSPWNKGLTNKSSDQLINMQD